jgi:hypothetical protein
LLDSYKKRDQKVQTRGVSILMLADAIALAEKTVLAVPTPVAAFPTPVDWRLFFNTIAPLN